MNQESGESREWLDEILLRTARGKGTFEELAGALLRLEKLSQIIPAAEFARFMGDMDQAVKEKGIGNVKVNDAEQPRVAGIRKDDGSFIPWLFTDDDQARQFAVTSGMIEPDASLPTLVRSCAAVLEECLAAGHAGLVIDEGFDHEINMNRSVMARLYSLVTFDTFRSLPQLQVVVHQGKVHYQKPKQGDGLQAFAYTTAEGADAGILRIQEKAPGLGFKAAPTLPHIENLLKVGVTLLVVNPALPTERTYNRDELVRMKVQPAEVSPPAAVESRPDPSLAPDPGRREAAGGDPSMNLPEIVRKATRYPALPLMPSPGRDDAASQARFTELRLEAEQQSIKVWEYIEALAFDLDLYIPVHERPVDGLTWPMIYKNPSEEGKTITYLHCEETRIREQLAGNGPEAQRWHHLLGVEAMRWVWGAPESISEVAINRYQGTDGWITFPNYWAVSAAFPLFYQIEALSQVARVPLPKIAALPGARGFKPEVARALLEGWRALLAGDGAAGRPESLVNVDGRDCLPLFTDQEQYFAFQEAFPKVSCAVKGSDGEPPFERLLQAAAGCDGVLLDPCGAQPLLLEHGDLLALALWARNGGPSPSGSELANETAILLEEGAIDAPTAGRIVACWPRYFVGLYDMENGGGAMMVTPDADCAAVFTSLDLTRDYISASEELGLLSKGAMKPVPLLHRWNYSVFQAIAASFGEGGVIDPVAGGGGGLHLDPTAVEAATQQVDRMLKPRVDGFLAGE